jgi:hypothetical protein
MLATLWHRITRNHRRNGQLKLTGQNREVPNPGDLEQPVDTLDREHSQENDQASAGRRESGSGSDGPLRMHQVPWIGIR